MEIRVSTVSELSRALDAGKAGDFRLDPGTYEVSDRSITVHDSQKLFLEDCVLVRARSFAGEWCDVINVAGSNCALSGGIITTPEGWWNQSLPSHGVNGYYDLRIASGRGIVVEGVQIHNTGGVVPRELYSTPEQYRSLPHGPDASLGVVDWGGIMTPSSPADVRITNCYCHRSTWSHVFQFRSCSEITLENCVAHGAFFLCNRDGAIVDCYTANPRSLSATRVLDFPTSNWLVANMSQDGFRGYGDCHNFKILRSRAIACRVGFQPRGGPPDVSPGWEFTNCRATGSSAAAFYFSGAPAATITNCAAHSNFSPTLIVKEGEHAPTVNGLWCLDNDQRRLLRSGENDYDPTTAEIVWRGDGGKLADVKGFSPYPGNPNDHTNLPGLVVYGTNNRFQDPTILGADDWHLRIHRGTGNIWE